MSKVREPAEESLSPLRVGIYYGAIAVAIALVTNLYPLVLDPSRVEGWILAVLATYDYQIALAAYLFLGILAALRVQPSHVDQDVPRRSLMLRDAVLAATVVAVMVGVALFIIIFLEATVFADAMRSYAQGAAPKIVSYINEARKILSDPPPPARLGPTRAALQPPRIWDLGRSIFNGVLRAVIMGAIGAVIGALRGRSLREENKQSEGAGQRA